MRPPCDCFSRLWNQGISKAFARPRLWSRLSVGLVAIFCLATALSAEPSPEAISAYERAQAALENHGDVPDSLVAILGSSKLRHWGYVRDVAWSPDGSLLASVGSDRYLRLWNADTGEQIQRFQSAPEGEGAVPGLIALAFDPAGKRLAAVTTTNAVRIWDVETGAESRLLKDDVKVADVAWHPARPLLATGGELTATLWNLTTGKIVRVLDSQDKLFKRKYSADAVRLEFSPDGRSIVVGHPDGSVRYWDVDSGEVTRTIQTHDTDIQSLAIDARRDLLATAGRDGMLRLWRLSTGDRLREIQAHKHYVQGLAFHPREDAIYSAGLDGAIRKWNLETGDKLLEWRASRSVGPESLAMHPSRDLIASAGPAVRLWNAATGEPHLETAGQLGGIHTLKFTPDGSRLVTAGDDATVRVWDANTRRQLSIFAFEDSPVTSLDLTRNGKLLVTANRYRSQVDLRFLANGVALNTFKTEDRVVGDVAASPDGKWLAATSADRGEHAALTIWDLSKNAQHGHLRTHGGLPFFSRDSKQLLVVGGQVRSGNRTKCGLSVWEVESLTNTLTLEDVQGLTWISASAISSDGADLILAGSSVDANEKSHHQLVFWDWSKNDTRLVVDTQEHVPLAMAIAPNGESLLTSNAFAGEVCIWDPRDGSLRQTIKLCERGFGAVGPSAFTLDSKQAAVGMGNGTIYLLQPQEPLPNVARKHAVPPPVEEPKPDQWQALLDQPAPELQAAGWLFGEPTTLAALRGKWVALYFWIDRESVQDMPGWMNMRECLGDQAPTVIVVNPSINGSLDDLRKYYDQDSREHWEGRGLPFRVLLDERRPNVIAGTHMETGGATFAAYRVMTSFRGRRPRSFALLIGPDGTVKGQVNSGFFRPPTRQLEALMGVKAAVPKWEKELLEQYALPDGVHLKHFPPPDSQARKDYCFFNYGSGQYVMAFRQGESTHRILTGRGASLEFVLNYVVGIESYEFVDPGNVLERTIAGDWCSRPGTPPADLLQALERLLNREPGWKLHFERVMVQQPVIVARGRWRQTALAGYEVKQGIFLTVDDVPDPSVGGGGSGTLDEMFNDLGGRTHFRFFKEISDAPKYDLRWQDRLASDMNDIRRRTPEGQEKLARVLKNLTRQTGLEMKIEEREVAAWRITAE